MVDLFEEIMKIKETGQRGAVATVVGTQGSTPREIGAKMLVREDGTIWGTIGGGVLEAQVCKEALKTIEEEKPRTIHFDFAGEETANIGMTCGGVMDIYVEPIIPIPKVIIFGGGHISLSVARMSAMAGFRVAIIDDRPQFANPERFPEAEEVICEGFASALAKLRVHKSSYLVIVTRGHLADQEVLEWAVNQQVRYIGMIGSRKKIQDVYRNLGEKGIPSAKLQQVHAPIGLNIGALTPEEIAVSIVAEMIQVRREERGSA